MHRVIFVLVFFFLLTQCQKTDLSGVDNLRSNSIGIIGHGGMGFSSPEVNLPANSLGSISKAVQNYQVDGVEVDVQMSADGTLFLYHDQRLQTLTDCLGCLYQWNDEVLEDCHYVRGFDTQRNNEQQLVQLQDALDLVYSLNPRPYIFLDLKTSLDCPNTFEYQDFLTKYQESLINIIEQYSPSDWIIVESSDISILRTLKEKLPEVQLSFFTRIDDMSIELAASEGFYGVSGNFDQVDAPIIKKAHDLGLFVTLGIHQTRNDAIDMIENSPDYIYTDNIPLLQSILN